MAWKLRRTLRRGPAGVDIVATKLEEFDRHMREALDAPMDGKSNNELTWPTHKLHYERNRYIFDLHRDEKITKKLVDYLVKEKVCDGALMAKWRKQGYERLCSLLAINKSNTNFGTVSVCRTPMRNRTGQIMPNVMTGCVSCASGDGGPIWWDDPVPEIAKRRIVAIDPGKAELVNNVSADESDSEPDSEVTKRIRLLKQNKHAAGFVNDGVASPAVDRNGSLGKRSTSEKSQKSHNPEKRKRIEVPTEKYKSKIKPIERKVTDLAVDVQSHGNSVKSRVLADDDKLQSSENYKRIEAMPENEEEKQRDSDDDDDPEVLERIRKLKQSMA